MRKLLIIALIFVCSKGYSLNYYFSNSGNDSYSSAQAQNPNTPWATLTKLNSFFTSLNAGDSVLFKRDDTFYGSITCRKSGSAGASIIFGAYGSGAKPIITGFTDVTSWTNLGSNIWESTSAVSTLSTCVVVSIDGVNTPVGRFPNSGYLTYQSFSTNTSITSSSLTGTPNWTGAEVVIRKQRWILNHNIITAQSGGTLTYSNGGAYNGNAGYGFFIQADSRTLDVQNEWYYNPSTKKIQVYSTSQPTNVQLATKDTLVYMPFISNITWDNISFIGANTAAFVVGASSNVTIQNCLIDFCYDGFSGQQFGTNSTNFKFQNNTVNHCQNNGLIVPPEFTSPTIYSNIIKNIGAIPGMGGNDEGRYEGMNVSGAGATISYNEVDTIGYIAIGFAGNNVTIANNFVNYFCYVKDDGGGIYTSQPFSGQSITDNVVLNGIGAGLGTNPNVARPYGIYADDHSSNIQILRNSVGNMGYGGIFLHDATNITLTNNTTYNNTYGLFVVNASPLSTIASMTGNIWFGYTASQLCLDFSGYSSFGSSTFNNNYYSRPINDNQTITIEPTSYTLQGWQTFSGKDLNSKKSPKTVTTLNDLRFEYNGTNGNKTVSLGAIYIDVAGIPYNGSITLLPYTSAVLIYSTSSTLPLWVSATNNSISCNGGTSTVTASASGGSAPYTYSIDGGSYQSSVTFNSISAGTHTITAKDAANTLANYGLNISQPSAITGYVETTTAPATVTTTASGGTGTLTYKIDAGSYQSSNIFTGVAAGNHTITVKDANACTFPISFTVIAAGVPLAISASSSDPDCYGGNGSVTIGASGGTSPYTGTGVFSQSAGTVTYTVTDNVGANKDTTITISQPTQVSIIQIITNQITTYGGTDSAFINATGGTGTLTYKLNSGSYQASDTFAIVSAGANTVYVKDSNACVNSQQFTMLSVPPATRNYIINRRGRIRYRNVN